MRAALSLALALALSPALLVSFGCNELARSLGGGGAAGSSSAASTAGTAGPAATAKACKGFRDISGACLDLSCLDDVPCDASSPVPCYPGLHGDGACFAGQCAYLNQGQGCGSGADCPCGLCGADGRCYEDRAGGCGSCAGKASKKGDGACKACLSSCQGTGPSCCSGTGCQCEGQCEGFLLKTTGRGRWLRGRTKTTRR